MKRKAIQLASKTIVVSLPAKWVEQHGVKKGDEIDVEEIEGKLFIGKEQKEGKIKSIKIDVSDLTDQVITWIVSALHKKGYDEITLTYTKANVPKLMEKQVKDLFIGFMIVEQKSGECTIRAVSQDNEKEFDSALRRAFLVTLAMGESCLEHIKNKKLNELGELISLERTNNQLTNYCERIINKEIYHNQQKNCFMYVIIWNLEKVCDEYKYLCEHLSKPENNKIILGKDTIDLFERVNKFFEGYYHLFYKFSLDKLNELNLEREKMNEIIEEVCKKKNDKEIISIYHLINIMIRVVDFSSSIVAINS